MKLHYSKELKQAFVAEPSEIREIVKLIQDNIGEVKITADCVDGYSRIFGNVDELIAYTNPKSKEIRSVSLSARTSYPGGHSSATVDLGKSSRRIYVDFNAQEDVVTRLEAATLDIVAGMRPWYNAVSRQNFVLVGFILSCLIWVIVNLITRDAKTLFILIPLFAVINATLLMVGLHLVDFVFPQAVFKIGQGKSRFENKELLRGVVITLIGSLPVTIAATVIIQLITRLL